MFAKAISILKKFKRLPEAYYRIIQIEKVQANNLKIHDIQYRDILDIVSGKKNIHHNDSVALKTSLKINTDFYNNNNCLQHAENLQKHHQINPAQSVSKILQLHC